VLELPSKKQKVSEKKAETVLNKKKVSIRSKKHLQKTVKRKIKNVKVTEHIRIKCACVTGTAHLERRSCKADIK